MDKEVPNNLYFIGSLLLHGTRAKTTEEFYISYRST